MFAGYLCLKYACNSPQRTWRLFFLGYYCPVASLSPDAFECGDSSVYCPRGSSHPTPVHDGFYTAYAGKAAGADQYWKNKNKVLGGDPYCSTSLAQVSWYGSFTWILDAQCGAPMRACLLLCARSEVPVSTRWGGSGVVFSGLGRFFGYL